MKFLLRAASTAALFALTISGTAFADDHGKDKMKEKMGHEKHEMMKSMTIVDIAAGNSDFSTLVAALKAADLVDTLSGKGPFTVFAPTNAAFNKLPEGTVANLLKPENKEKLTSILTYHVVPGKVKAKDVVGLDSAKTVQGGSVDIAVEGKSVMIDNAKVIKTDIKGSNGVIHVIDSVIMPK